MRTMEPMGRTLLGVLAVGVGGWILASGGWLVWFFATTTDGGLGAVAAPFVAWSVGYLPGGAALVLYAAVQVFRRRLPASVGAWAVLVYFLPVLLNGVVAGGLLGLIPRTASEGDLGGMVSGLSGPLLALLYVIGLAVGIGLSRAPLGRAVAGIVAPPLAGTVLVGGWLAWTAVGSPEFQHRDTFAFAVEEAVATPSGLTVDATLEVKRPGRWDYRAIYLEVVGGSTGGRADEIEWLDGAPAAPGVYRLRLVFRNLRPQARATKREVFFAIRERRGALDDRPVAEFRVPVEPRPLPSLGPRGDGGGAPGRPPPVNLRRAAAHPKTER